MDNIELSDGRRLEIRVTGPEDGPVLVFHHGTPGSARGYRIVEEPAHERGLRVVWMSRPGYGDSSRQPGRSVVNVVSDTAEVLDALGVDARVCRRRIERWAPRPRLRHASRSSQSSISGQQPCAF